MEDTHEAPASFDKSITTKYKTLALLRVRFGEDHEAYTSYHTLIERAIGGLSVRQIAGAKSAATRWFWREGKDLIIT